MDTASNTNSLNFIAEQQSGVHLCLVVFIKGFILGHSEVILPITDFPYRNTDKLLISAR